MNMIVRSFEHRLQPAGLGGVTACEVTTREQLQTRMHPKRGIHDPKAKRNQCSPR